MIETNEEGFSLESMPDIGILPRYVYRVNCTGIDATVSKSHNQMLVMDFEVLGPDPIEVDGKKYSTAGTKFRSWFVWTQSPQLKINCLALQRGFGLPQRKYKNLADLQASITEYMCENAVGSTFMWRLYTEPQYKKEALTTAEIEAGKRQEDAPDLLDSNGEKILARHNVIAPWSEIVGDYQRLQTA